MPPLDNNHFEPIHCASASCGLPHHFTVAYCPFCGTATAPAQAGQLAPAVAAEAVVRPEPAGEPLAETGATAAPAAAVAQPAEAAPPAEPAIAGAHAAPGAVRPKRRAGAGQQKKQAGPVSARLGEAQMSPVGPTPAMPAKKTGNKGKWLFWGIVLLVAVYALSGRDKTTPASPAPADGAAVSTESAPPASPVLPKEIDAAPVEKPAAASQAPVPVSVADALATVPVAAAQPGLSAMLAAARQTEMMPLLQALRGLAQLQLPQQADRAAARAANSDGVEALERHAYGEAVEKFKKAVQTNPRDHDAASNLAFALYKNGDLPDARHAALAALTLGPEQPLAWGNLAQVLADQGETDQAVSAFLLAVRFSPDRAKARDALKSMARSGPSLAVRDVAGKALEVGTEAGPAEPEVRLPAVRSPVAPTAPTLPATTPVPMRDASSSVVAGLLEDGTACMESRRYDCAISSAKAALRMDSQHPRARALLRQAETEQKKAMDSITIN